MAISEYRRFLNLPGHPSALSAAPPPLPTTRPTDYDNPMPAFIFSALITHSQFITRLAYFLPARRCHS
jgi:hypothetical protein